MLWAPVLSQQRACGGGRRGGVTESKAGAARSSAGVRWGQAPAAPVVENRVSSVSCLGDLTGESHRICFLLGTAAQWTLSEGRDHIWGVGQAWSLFLRVLTCKLG